MKTRRQKKAEPETSERWLITYADMITLLMVFFIVMYAMSMIDVNKYEMLRISLANEMGNPMIVNLDEPAPPSEQQDTEWPFEQTGPTTSNDEINDEIDDLYEQLKAYITSNHLEDKVVLINKPEGISLSLQEVLLFETGQADIKKEGVPYLTSIAEMMKSLDNPISVEGHTDERPIYTSEFRSNWELSTARALTVLHFMIDHRIAPERLSVTGYGEYQPISDDWKSNRRVDLVILRDNPKPVQE